MTTQKASRRLHNLYTAVTFDGETGKNTRELREVAGVARGRLIDLGSEAGGFDIAAPIVYLVCINAIAFALYGIDKVRARQGEWRISEKGLMFVTVFGGSVGALAGMHVFHHKTRKPLFAIGVPAVLVVHVAVLAWLVLVLH